MSLLLHLNWVFGAIPEIAGIAAVTAVIYALPGLVLLRLFFPEELPWSERLAIALGTGLGLPPLLLELSRVVGLPWQRETVWGYVLIAAIALTVLEIRRRREFIPKFSPSLQTVLFCWLLGVILLIRLYSIRDLPVGMWGDSYQHTMIAQLLADNRGLFSSWEPYAPIATFTYHFGFHADVVFFHWLTGTPITKSVLYVGQILNVAAALLAYGFTIRLTRERNAGLWAMLMTGLLNAQPAYFFNWGRYSQLAGQVIMPVVAIAWLKAIDSEEVNWRVMIFTALASAALALTHYIVTFFAALFVLAWLMGNWIVARNWRDTRRVAFRAMTIVAISSLLDAPWFINTLSGHLVRNAAGFISGAVSGARIANYSALPPVSPFYISGPILFFALVGLLVASVQRDWKVVLLAIWSLLMVLATTPQVLALPGAGIIDAFTVYLALYIPLIPLAAYFVGIVQSTLEQWKARLVPLGAALVLWLASIEGAQLNLGHFDPQYQLFTKADARAMEWIKTSVPSDASFLVNSFPAYGGTLIAGTDGGWWIPLLTGRQTNLPPLTYGSERGEADDFDVRVNRFAEELRGQPLTNSSPIRIDLTIPTALEMLRKAKIKFIYIGAHQAPGPEVADQIDMAVLESSPSFRKVYEDGGVRIYEFVGESAQ